MPVLSVMIYEPLVHSDVVDKMSDPNWESLGSRKVAIKKECTI